MGLFIKTFCSIPPVYINNHTAVWGSYWQDGRWGFACCHGFSKNSYCTGDAGKEAAKSAAMQANGTATLKRTTLVDQHLEALQAGKAGTTKEPANSKKRKGEGDVELDAKKLKAHLDKEKKRLAGASEQDSKYMSSKVEDVTEEELEAFRLSRRDADDPMNAFLED